jgi:hypothetical protein
MDQERVLNDEQDAVIGAYVLQVTIPLLTDGNPAPRIRGTGTLFTHEERYFIVTAAHIFKEDEDDPSSADIDLTEVACPTGLVDAKLRRLGKFSLYRPPSPSRVDAAIVELHDGETIETLKNGWQFLALDAVAPFPFNARFMVTGFLYEGVKWDGNNVGQRFLKLTTDPLHYVPETAFPEPSVDRFFYLQDQAPRPDGSWRDIPKLQGLSGGSLWAYTEPPGLWSASKAVKIVAVQSSYLRGKWIRCTDWSAVRSIFREPEIGFHTPP